jgi:hypothetical protein
MELAIVVFVILMFRQLWKSHRDRMSAEEKLESLSLLPTPSIPRICRGKMKATELVAGQEVYMFCGSEHYGFAKGEVVNVTSEGVEVQVVGEPLIRLDNNGIELEADRRKRHGFEPEPGFRHDRFMQSIWYTAPECGPWTLDDMPFAERTANIEESNAECEASAKYYGLIRNLAVGQKVWMVSGSCFAKGEVVKVIPEAKWEMRKGKMVIITAAGIKVRELRWGSRKGGELRHFYYAGTQSDDGPWRLDDMPFTERTALLEQAGKS